jgi:hypothetical protein
MQRVPPILVNVSSAISEEAKSSFLHDVSTLSIAASSLVYHQTAYKQFILQ